jgi:hypothetical protein
VRGAAGHDGRESERPDVSTAHSMPPVSWARCTRFAANLRRACGDFGTVRRDATRHADMAGGDISLSNDPRWRRLLEQPVRCASCEDVHHGLFDIVYAKPAAWPGDDSALSENSAVLRETNFLSEDFCVLNDEHFFVRCVLDLPIIGAPGGERFGYGVWSTLSRKNFAIYRDLFGAGTFDGEGPWFGWFSNHLRGYPDTFNLRCQVHPLSGRLRPWIELEPTDHPLASETRDGVTFDRLLDIYALHGHDLRRALVD